MAVPAWRIAALAVVPALLNAGTAAAQHSTATTSVTATAAVTLVLRMADGRRQFRPGETIPIELEFKSAVPRRFVVDGATYDRSGRLTLDQFRIEPDDRVVDPMLDYFASIGGTIGGGIRRIDVLGDEPVVVALELNDWFRVDVPGTYWLSVRTQRVTDEAARGTTPSIVPVESNAVSFEILPRDPEWEAAEVGAALRILDGSNRDDRRKGCRMLRFLANDAAVDEMVRRYDADGESGCHFEYMAGLVSAPSRARVVRQMEAGLRAPDQPVTLAYVRTLALLSVYVQHPELRAPQTRETRGRGVEPGQVSRTEFVPAAQAMYEEILTAALPGKTDAARAITLAERISRPADSTASNPAASSADIRAQLAAAFPALPAERQVSLLQFDWPRIASAAMRPILRRLAETPAPPSTSLRDLALRRLYDVAPEEARALILKGLRNPSAGASLRTLGMLPDRELPELDDVLAANVDADDDYDALSLHAELLQRYASSAASARVLSRIDGTLERMACRPKAALIAYFVRADPALAQTMIEAALGSRETTGCYRAILGDLARLHMDPAIESAAIARLDDPDADVVRSAVETLGRYGTAAAREPLRARFERWHQAWDGRQEALRYSPIADRAQAAPGMVEAVLLDALGRGRGWLADEDDLRGLREWCVTDSCRMQCTRMMASAGETRITILRVEEPDDSIAMLAQYHLTSMSALEQKLAQYPPGSSFTLDVTALDSATATAVASRLQEVARAHHFTIRR